MAFARISEMFVMMLGHQPGRGPVELLVLWSMLSLVRALAAYAGGRRADEVWLASVPPDELAAMRAFAASRS
jgi:hypothetical protein